MCPASRAVSSGCKRTGAPAEIAAKNRRPPKRNRKTVCFGRPFFYARGRKNMHRRLFPTEFVRTPL